MNSLNTYFNLRQFIIITLITSIWINCSEVFRYFVFVMPQMQAFFAQQNGVATMNGWIFLIWGFWDTLLTAALVFFTWLYTQQFGNQASSILKSATFVWASVFVIFWVAAANMGIAPWNILWITLPLSWLEMTLGAWIAHKLYSR